MILYMEVTQDEYELPVAVASSVDQLSRLRGVAKSSIFSSISREKAGKSKSKYKRVEIEDD